MPTPPGLKQVKSPDELTAKFVRMEQKLDGRRIGPDATLLFALPELDYHPSIPILTEKELWRWKFATTIAQAEKQTK